jgi:hypothetical protein
MSPAVLFLFVFLSIVIISVFSFLSIAAWADSRRKEREAYYEAEAMRRVAETSGEGGKYLIEMMREEDRLRHQALLAQEAKKREGYLVGGLVNIGIGLALMIFLRSLGHDAPYLVGLILVFIGLALLLSNFLIKKPPAQQPPTQ